MLKMLRRRLSARIRLGSTLRAFKQINLDGSKSEDWIKGWIEGWFKSRQQGQAELLCRMLACRFGSLPSDMVAQILAADVEQIEDWADYALLATTLAEVFSLASEFEGS